MVIQLVTVNQNQIPYSIIYIYIAILSRFLMFFSCWFTTSHGWGLLGTTSRCPCDAAASSGQPRYRPFRRGRGWWLYGVFLVVFNGFYGCFMMVFMVVLLGYNGNIMGISLGQTWSPIAIDTLRCHQILGKSSNFRRLPA